MFNPNFWLKFIPECILHSQRTQVGLIRRYARKYHLITTHAERNRTQIKNDDCELKFWNSLLQKEYKPRIARAGVVRSARRAAAELNYEHFYPSTAGLRTPARPRLTPTPLYKDRDKQKEILTIAAIQPHENLLLAPYKPGYSVFTSSYNPGH